MKIHRFRNLLVACFLLVLIPFVSAHAAWWNSDQDECPCFTSSLIDSYLVLGAESDPEGVEVLGGMSDISGEVVVVFPVSPPADIFFKASSQYTFGPDNVGKCTVQANGLTKSLLFPLNEFNEYEMHVTQIQHNACLNEIKGSSAFRFRLQNN